MHARSTLRDVAAAAHVSISTASMALNGSPRVAEATRARVLACARELDYTPDPAARALASPRHRNVSLVLAPSLIDEFDSTSRLFAHRLLLTLDELLARAGLTVSRATVTDGSMLDQSSVVVFIGDDECFDNVKVREGTPVVSAGRVSSAREPAASLVHNQANIAADLLAHLSSQGCSRLAIIRCREPGNYSESGPHALSEWADRYRIMLDVWDIDFTAESCRAAAKSAVLNGADGLFVMAPFPAAALRGVAAAGREVPADVLVVGRGEGILEAQTSPAMSAMSMEAVPCANEIADAVRRVLSGERGFAIPLPHKLIVRASSLRSKAGM